MGVRHHLRVISGGARCRSTYPGAAVTASGRPIRCDLRAAHDGQHGHGFWARYWDDNDVADQRFVERLLRYVGPSEPEITESELRLLDGNR